MSSCTHHWTVTSECPLCLRAEIKRLRGLLREAEKMWPNPGLSTESSQWYKRVREALGESR